MRTFSVLVLAGFAAFAPVASAESQEFDLTPLVSVHARLVFRLVKTDRYDENLFIARDGTASVDLSFLPSLSSWMAETASGKGSANRIATLKRAVAAGGAGLQQSCTLAVTDGWSGTYEISWYGKGDRTNDFVVVLQYAPSAKPPLCPSEVKDLIEALEQYASDVLGVAVRPDLR